MSKQTAVMFTHEGDSPSFAFDSGKATLGISELWRGVLLGGTWVRRFQGGGQRRCSGCVSLTHLHMNI